jgi:hypothetical protein
MAAAAASFGFLMLLPADFAFPVFALLLLLNGVGMGLFAAPNTTGIMNSVPARRRGVASGMRATFQNTGMVLSIGVFFSLMIIGLAATLPSTMRDGLERHGVPAATAERVAGEPPVGTLFAAFLGYNPMEASIPPATLAALSPADRSEVTGKTFFPQLISEPFTDGLRIAFSSSLVMCLIAAGASWLRGGGRARSGADDADGTLAFGAPRDDDPEAAPRDEEWVPA